MNSGGMYQKPFVVCRTGPAEDGLALASFCLERSGLITEG